MALDSGDHSDNRHNGGLCDNHQSNNSHLSSSGLCSNDRQNSNNRQCSSGHHNGLQGIGNCKSTCVGHHKSYCGGLVY